MALGMMEIILLFFALGPGGGSAFPNDALSLVPTVGYLQHRGVEVTPTKLLETVKKPAADAKASALQLVAIRWFGENKDKLGDQAAAVRAALTEIEKGAPGFARDYAKLALARLDGKPPAPLHVMPKGSLRGQALELFPDDVTFFGGVEFRAASAAASPDPALIAAAQELRESMLKRMPPAAAQEIYKFIDSVGNVRIDRVAFGHSPDAAKDNPGRIYVRITGQGDAKRLVEFIQSQMKTTRFEERKRPRGEVFRMLISDSRHDPSFCLIGDTEMILAGPMGGTDATVGAQIIDQILAVHAGKKSSVLKGPFAQSLLAAPENARGLVFGALPEHVNEGLAGTPLGVAPGSVALHMVEGKDGATDIRLRASFEKAEDAKKFADNSKTLLQQLGMALKSIPVQVKPETIATLQKALDGVEVKAEGPGITATASLTPATVQALLNLFEEAMKGLR